jgi:hypothetical protein
VLHALGRLIAMGDDMPSEARLASEAGCGRRSVQRAKTAARSLGLLAWERRFAGAGLRRELPCAYRAETPVAPVVRRERQADKRVQESGFRRSVEAQIAACGAITADNRRLWEHRRQRLAEAARNRVGKGLTFAAVR